MPISVNHGMSPKILSNTSFNANLAGLDVLQSY
jgi:hypothetical protein